MAVRINKAKNFKGKAYVAADELDNLIQTLTFAGYDTSAAGNSEGDWELTFTTLDEPDTVQAVDLTPIKNYIDNKSITVTAGNGIAIDDTTNPLSPTIAADIDLRAVTTESGYAATYQLFVKNNGTATTSDVGGYTPIGAKINIVKDNLVKEGSLVYGTQAALSGGAPVGEQASKDATHVYPFVKLTLNTNINGDATTVTTGEDVTYLYIPVNDLFHDKEAGNGIDSAALASNVIQVVVDGTNKVYTATATTGANILTVDSTGIHIADIQGAINYAVDDEHAKASAAITSLSTGLTNLGSSTSAAVVALNTRVETVATNAQTAVNAVGDAVEALDSKVDAAIDDVNTNVETAIDTVVSNVNSAINTNVTAVNNAVSAAVDTVNEKVGSAVSNVNANVSSLADETSAAISSVNSNVTNLKNTVSATISANNTALDTVVSNVNSNVSAVITNVNTALGAVANSTERAVKVTEVTVTPGLKSGTTGEYEGTVTAKYILAVFGKDNDEIYPDIVRGAAGTGANDGKYTYTLTADYGAVQEPTIEAWKVICANDVASATIPTDVAAPATVNTVDYTNATNNVAYTDAGEGTDAVYSNVMKTDATFVNAADVDYDVTAVGDKTVASGNGATAPTPADAVSEAALSYSGKSNA